MIYVVFLLPFVTIPISTVFICDPSWSIDEVDVFVDQDGVSGEISLFIL